MLIRIVNLQYTAGLCGALGYHQALPKVVNDLYADVFANTYKFRKISLRYFNVFGQRQNPNGEYLAEPIYQAERTGDVKLSQPDISEAKKYLGYDPQLGLQASIQKAMLWYLKNVVLNEVKS